MRNAQNASKARTRMIASSVIRSRRRHTGFPPTGRRTSLITKSTNPTRMATAMTNATVIYPQFNTRMQQVMLSYFNQNSRHGTDMKIKLFLLFLLFCVATDSFAQTSERQQFIRTEAPVIALAHVRVIDGTGAAPKEDQTIIISVGNIHSVEPSAAAKIPAHPQTLAFNG